MVCHEFPVLRFLFRINGGWAWHPRLMNWAGGWQWNSIWFGVAQAFDNDKATVQKLRAKLSQRWVTEFQSTTGVLTSAVGARNCADCCAGGRHTTTRALVRAYQKSNQTVFWYVAIMMMYRASCQTLVVRRLCLEIRVIITYRLSVMALNTISAPVTMKDSLSF